MNKTWRLVVVCALLAIAASAHAEPSLIRYPARLPDWLWDVDSNSHLMSANFVLSMRGDIARLAQLQKMKDDSAADALNDAISIQLGSKFAPRLSKAGKG